jgi:hypothetical protein
MRWEDGVLGGAGSIAEEAVGPFQRNEIGKWGGVRTMVQYGVTCLIF